jgi:predicted unusual protein kinase regulating ubiquinone biosynthesis (AarF/ABC1/UbiB family)
MEWFFEQTKVARHALEDMRTVTASERTLCDPLLFMTRFGDLTRSNSFLWTETNFKILERYSRVLHTGQSQSRGLVLSTLAADIIAGYLSLNGRKQLSPALVPPADWEWQHQRSAQRILSTAAALGGVLIKACQFASTRPDILPLTYVQTLSTLQDRVEPHPWSEIEKAIRQALGRNPQQVFASIEHEPIASASIAQVHRARLLDGQEVAVKVQYPDIQSIIAIDSAVLQKVVTEIARLAPSIQLQPILDYLQETLPLELDFLHEAAAMTELRQALSHRQDVLIPIVKAELSTRQLLVMELVDGIKITDRAALQHAGISPGAVAHLLNDVYAEQMFRLGILHADPHPGNLLVQAGPKLVLLDHGLTVHLNPSLVQSLGEMVQALSVFDFERLQQALIKAGMQFDEQVDINALLQLIGVLLGEGQDKEALNTLEVGQQFSRSVGHIPVDLILVGRALGLLDGISKQLDPDINALEIVAGYVS